MTKYTVDQQDNLIEFLEYSVEEGYLDSDVALDLIKQKDWATIDHMRGLSELRADAQLKGEA